MIWRRKRLPAALEEAFEGFQAVLAEVEPAKDVLTEVMPTTRMPGVALPDALIEFETRMAAAGRLMPAWRRPEVEAEWSSCDAGIREASARAQRFREDPPELGGFEGLIWAVEELLHPLESFRPAAERFRRLRVPVK